MTGAFAPALFIFNLLKESSHETKAKPVDNNIFLFSLFFRGFLWRKEYKQVPA